MFEQFSPSRQPRKKKAPEGEALKKNRGKHENPEKNGVALGECKKKPTLRSKVQEKKRVWGKSSRRGERGGIRAGGVETAERRRKKFARNSTSGRGGEHRKKSEKGGQGTAKIRQGKKKMTPWVKLKKKGPFLLGVGDKGGGGKKLWGR